MLVKVYDNNVALEAIDNYWHIHSLGGLVDEVWQVGDQIVVHRDSSFTQFTLAGRAFVIVDQEALIGKVMKDA